MGLLDGKTILVTGVLTPESIAFAVAERCKQQGAMVILTGFDRGMRLTQRSASRLGSDVPVYEWDVTQPEHGLALRQTISDNYSGRLDGVLHAIGFMPPAGLSDDLLDASWDDVAAGFHISAYSLVELARVVKPLMWAGGDIIALDFDNSSRAWGPYGHMGPAKAALQAYVRSLAVQLGPEGIRVNAISAGPLRTMAAKSIPGFSQFEEVWDERAPLGWDVNDPYHVADACLAFFAKLLLKTTGAVIPVDGGFSVVGG